MKAHQSLTEAMFAVAKANLPEHITSVAVHVHSRGGR
jgi:ABC-type antimicrobial peptide transport system permease subunit